MGTGATKSSKSNVVNVTSNNRTTVIDNRVINRRARPDGQAAGSSGTSSRKSSVLTKLLPTPPTRPGEGQAGQIAIQDLTAGRTHDGAMGASSPVSWLSSRQSSKSVGEELDNLRSELDQVLIGHYYAVTKPATGVLRTAEIAVLERHNQLQPLPIDYQPVVGTSREGPGPSHWIRPEDLIRQERELMEKMQREDEGSVRRVAEVIEVGTTNSTERLVDEEASRVRDGIAWEEKEEEKKVNDQEKEGEPDCKVEKLTLYDLEDDQDRGDFDVLKFKAVNTPKDDEEGSDSVLDVYARSTYKNYATSTKRALADNENLSPRMPRSSADHASKDIEYDKSEEALLQVIETDY